MDKTVSKELAKLRKMWKDTQPTTGYPRVEDGDYLATIEEMSVGKSKQSGRIQVMTSFRIIEGPEKDKNILRFDGLDNEIGIGFFKGFCEVIGFEIPEDIEELPEALEEFVAHCDDIFNIRVKTKGDFQNVSVLGVSDYEMDKSSSFEEEEEEEDLRATREDEEPLEEPEEEEEYEEVRPRRQPRVKPGRPKGQVLDKKKFARR